MAGILQFDRARRRKLVALLAVLILGVFATVQVVHGHVPGRAENRHCDLCLVAHGVAILVALPAMAVLLIAHAQTSALEIARLSSAPTASFFTRAPPATA